MHVFLTGAAGHTGRLVQERLASSGHKIVGLVRRPEQQSELPGETVIGDILQPDTYTHQLQDADALIILTSAVPKKAAGSEQSDLATAFYYEDGQYPEQIDWEGQKLQIDAAKGSRVQHIVLVGPMGATQKENNILNRLGNGNILVWKRKAEEYLIDSGIPYTVVNAGILTDEPGGQRALLLGKADDYLGSGTRTVPREDVAEVLVQALLHPEARNKAFDLVSKRPPGQPPADWKAFFEQATPGL